MRIFVLEDDPDRILWLRDRLFGHDVKFIHTVSRADEFVPPYDLVLLDHDLGGRQLEKHEDDGAAVATEIHAEIGSALVVIHSYNGDGAKRMAAILSDCRVLIAPYRGGEFNAILDQIAPVGHA